MQIIDALGDLPKLTLPCSKDVPPIFPLIHSASMAGPGHTCRQVAGKWNRARRAHPGK